MGGSQTKEEPKAAAAKTTDHKRSAPLPVSKPSTSSFGASVTSTSEDSKGYISTRRPRPALQKSRSSPAGPSGDVEPDVLKSDVLKSKTPPSLKTIRISNPKESALLVVAIDFGTTYSGYGYSFKANKEQFFTNYWDDVHIKTPTAVLLDPGKKLHSFGSKARKDFEDLIKQGVHDQWYFVEKFKMKLFVRDGPLDVDMMLDDIGDKPIKALDVFAASLEYMVKHVKDMLNERQQNVQITKDTDIHWILTVPAIWDDLSKRFMRKAATQAGIRDDMLSLALEPEAASLFCKKDFTDIKIRVGTRYLVLDLGGGTADITCHEVNADGTLKELHKATGGDFGGTSVDTNFMNILIRLFGAKVMKRFRKKHMKEYWELIQTFERKKRAFDGREKIKCPFPIEIIEMFEADAEETITQTMQSSTLKNKVEFKQGRIFIDLELAKEMFDATLDKISQATQEVMDKVDNIEHLVLVGGFSESPYLQKVLGAKFQNLIRIPKEPSGAVLKGAVIFGHETRAISTRVCKFTYGIARMMKFKPDQHPERKRVKTKAMDYCDDLFNKHIEIGKLVSLDSAGKATVHDYYPPVTEMKQAVLEVYASDRRNPKFIDDHGCQFVGLIKVNIDPQGDIWSKLDVKLIFGGTELIVEVHEVNTNKITQGSVEFFG